MRKAKLVLCIILVLGLIFSLTGCSIGNLFGENIKVDKDGNVIIKDDDNNEVVIGEKKWDKSKMHDLEAPKAKIDTSVITEDECMYGFTDMKESDAKEYIEKIKSKGFTYNSVTLDDVTYIGTNKEGFTISFTYDKESESGTVVSGKGDKPSDDDNNNGAVIGGDDKKWDSSKMGGLPDPGAEVVSFWTADGDTSYTLEVISYDDYVEKIKDGGFTEDIDAVEIDDVYVFTALNSNGDRITFSVSSEMTTILFEKED